MDIDAPAPPSRLLPLPRLHVPQTHSPHPATPKRRSVIRREILFRLPIRGERLGGRRRRERRFLRLGRRSRAASEAADGPADLDAALDAPEPDEREDGRADEDVEDGEDVGETGWRGDEELCEVDGKACCVDGLWRTRKRYVSAGTEGCPGGRSSQWRRVSGTRSGRRVRGCSR